MRKSFRFSAVFSLFLLATASITWAQTISSQKGLITVTFNTAYGNIKVYLPDDLRSGDVISGSIITDPTGKNAKQTEKNQNDLAKYLITLNNETFPVSKERFQFIENSDRKSPGPIELLQPDRIRLAELIIPEAEEKGPASGECLSPSHALTGSPLRIFGPFDGNSSNTNCTIDNNPVVILAESPRQCIISYPADAGGVHTLNVQETNKQSCAKSISGVRLDVSAGKLNLQKGEKTFIDVAVTGLRNLPDNAKLILSNTTSNIVTMMPSNNVLIILSPDSVGSGNFNRRFDIQSLKTGSFIVNVDLDLPGVQFEVKKLDKPRKLENEALHTGLSEAIKKLEADAGGAQGKEYNILCESCKKCIGAMAGKWAEALVEKLGNELIKESVGKAIGMFMESKELLKKLKEMVDKANEAADKAEELADELEKKIKAEELQLLVFQDQLCKSNQNCVVSAMIFYDPATGCVTAFVKCNGRAGDCCPKAFNTAKITYCTDEHGMPKDMPHVEVISE
jgi:hypothetical protein